VLASNVDLKREVEAGRFRADLYYRINVVTIHMPSLVERLGDIPRLAEYFLKKYRVEMKKDIHGITPEGLAAMQRYHWPGNVRELENVIERTLVNSCDPTIDESAIRASADRVSEDDERERIATALERNHWNRERAARELGLSRVTLWRRMSRYQLYS
jgi:DNA-binding NtrC family response regulator